MYFFFYRNGYRCKKLFEKVFTATVIDVIFFYETYTNKKAFDVHLNSKHYLSFNEEVTPWVKEKIVTQLEKQAL